MFLMYTFTGAVQFWEYGQGGAFYEHKQMNSGWVFVFFFFFFCSFQSSELIFVLPVRKRAVVAGA